MTLEIISVVSQSVIAVSALIASIWIPLTIDHRSSRQARVQYLKSIHDMWMRFDEFALRTVKHLRIADDILEPDSCDTDDQCIKKWIGYMIWNLVHATYAAYEQGLTVTAAEDEREALAIRIKTICRDPMMVDLLNNFYGRTSMGRWAKSLLADSDLAAPAMSMGVTGSAAPSQTLS